MKRAQIIVLGIAVVAGVAAMYLASSSAPEQVVKIVQTPSEAPAPIATSEVLVAAVDVNMGQTIAKTDMRWQAWPKEVVPANTVRRNESANAIDELGGSIARTTFVAGEPIRREKLIMANGSGFMSAILPAGMRAVAISIDSRGSTSAGGFILPNDRVDVIRTFRDEEGSSAQAATAFRSETILSNIRVLAIGQNIQEEKDGKKTVIGETATLELDPRQAETITLAQKVGQLSLSLRSISDANTKIEEVVQGKDGSMTIVRYGVSRQSTKN
jgi:pilus assembly protein CpaB